MNELIELIKPACKYLENLKDILYGEFSREDKELEELIKKMKQTIDECEVLKVGHLART
jgi:hypothetical protein